MKISQINIYPIKSCGGISLDQAQLSDRGLLYDRRWMIVDPQGNCLTQRDNAQMALIKTAIEGQNLRIWHHFKKIAPLELPLEISMQYVIEVGLWGDRFPASRHSDATDAWISGVLGQTCHLVYMHKESRRAVDPEYAQAGEIVSAADGYPYLIIGEESLAHLNAKLSEKGEEEVPMNRFRPNFVFQGGSAHLEDEWSKISIGETTFKAVKPCARCQLTTIEQETAKQGKEPLRTLSTYRKQGAKVLFGMNLLHEGNGVIKIGDEIRTIGA
ncbi:MAG: MOSC domain-containing protein [Bacteroidia bacterium]|nr:MOSC domain-containing protein [Bacteroidia bacterium]